MGWTKSERSCNRRRDWGNLFFDNTFIRQESGEIFKLHIHKNFILIINCIYNIFMCLCIGNKIYT